MLRSLILFSQIQFLLAGVSVYSDSTVCCGRAFRPADVRSKAAEVLRRPEPIVQVLLRPTSASTIISISEQSPEECAIQGRELHQKESYAFVIRTPSGAALYHWSPISGRPYTHVFWGSDPLSEQDGIELVGFDTRFYFPLNLLTQQTRSSPPEVRLLLSMRKGELNASSALAALERVMARLNLRKAYAFVRSDTMFWPGDCRLFLRPSQWFHDPGIQVKTSTSTYYCVSTEADRFCRSSD